MTYSPQQAGVMTGEDYWTSIGLIGGTTGMESLPCSMPRVITAPDGTSTGDTFTLTDSVYKVVGGLSGVSWNLDGGDGSTSYSKVLVMGYSKGDESTQIMNGLGVSEDLFGTDYGDTDDWTDTLIAISRAYTDKLEIFKWDTSGTQSIVASDATIYNALTATAPVYGIAFYCEAGSPGVQKAFFKMGSTSQWFQVLSITIDFGNAKSLMYFANYWAAGTSTARIITPVMAWGLEA